MKYICIFRLVLRCFLVARKENLTGVSTGLIGWSKNLDLPGRSTQPVSISASIQKNCFSVIQDTLIRYSEVVVFKKCAIFYVIGGLQFSLKT